MIDPKTRAAIETQAGIAAAPIKILNAETEHQAQFIQFAKDWADITGHPQWEMDTESADLPGFALKENIIYSALPLERELPPFLEGLSQLESPTLSTSTRALADKIEMPCTLTLFIALHCPHCPGMVKTLIPLAAQCDKIQLHIIDGSLFPEKAQALNVMSAPCLILDQEFRWTGAVDEEEILSMILNRNPAQLGTATLQNILEQGDADWITDQMIQAGQIFEGFYGLLLHETWSVRLGAMVVVESLAEKAPELGLKLADHLTRVFADMTLPVQGDILYALGEIGNISTRAWIETAVAADAHEDLKDAAQDALESIDQRQS